MKNKYIDQLNKMQNFFINYKELDEQKLIERSIESFDKFIDELTLSKDQEVLEILFDFFLEEFELNFEGIIEHLKAEIGSNYSLNQILEAFYKKFDTLIKNDIDMAVEMSMWFFESEMFEKFRKMFNTVKSTESNRFLNEFLRWWPDYQSQVDILRHDMDEW